MHSVAPYLVAVVCLAHSLNAQNRLSSQVVQNVDATANVTVNVTLPPAQHWRSSRRRHRGCQRRHADRRLISDRLFPWHTADANGNYAVVVLRGTNYNLTFQPGAGAP
jgi:hypothetical protein